MDNFFSPDFFDDLHRPLTAVGSVRPIKRECHRTLEKDKLK